MLQTKLLVLKNAFWSTLIFLIFSERTFVATTNIWPPASYPQAANDFNSWCNHFLLSNPYLGTAEVAEQFGDSWQSLEGSWEPNNSAQTPVSRTPAGLSSCGHSGVPRWSLEQLPAQREPYTVATAIGTLVLHRYYVNFNCQRLSSKASGWPVDLQLPVSHLLK